MYELPVAEKQATTKDVSPRRVSPPYFIRYPSLSVVFRDLRVILAGKPNSNEVFVIDREILSVGDVGRVS